ncbi:hypothetical protein HWI79_1632 [Cryptosporidium felis]|nr:hypothetical protein HWI79_1632 [Cryptosporidium felis]
MKYSLILFLGLFSCFQFNFCASNQSHFIGKLGIDVFIESHGLQNISHITSSEILSNIYFFSENISRVIREEVFIKDTNNQTIAALQSYKTNVKQMSEELIGEIKESLDIHLCLLDNIAERYKKANSIISNPYNPINLVNDKELINELNTYIYNDILFLLRSARPDKSQLLNDLRGILKDRLTSQNGVLEKVIFLHKLTIEIEMIEISNSFDENPQGSRDLEKKMDKFVRMLYVLQLLTKLSNGIFQQPFEISITKATKHPNVLDESSSQNTFFIVYPKVIINSEYHPSDRLQESFESALISQEFHSSEAFNSSISKCSPNKQDPPANLIPEIPNDQEFTIGTISPTSTALDAQTNETRVDEYSKIETVSVDTYRVHETENFTEPTKFETPMNKFSSNIAIEKCFEFQYICPAVRHLNDSEMFELELSLFPYRLEAPLAKDENLIWAISESLIENYGARRRLLEVLSQKIIDLSLSINRSNTNPIMNTGESRYDRIDFYRKSHYDLLLVLFSLKDFLSSNNSSEISINRKNFTDKFVPLISTSSPRRLSKSMNSEKKLNACPSSPKNPICSNFLRTRNAFEKNGEYKFPISNKPLTPNSDINAKPDISELCTRLITTISVVKSVKSFNDNTYKFAQKVCSMIFELPMHNILSSRDHAWLTGLTLVDTVNTLIKKNNISSELFINHKNALRALNYAFSQKIYNLYQACTQSLVSQKSTAIYKNGISLHAIKPLMKSACAEYFGVSIFSFER